MSANEQETASAMEAPAVAASVAASKPKKSKGPPPDLVIPQPKPKLSKAERRALQEQQRAAKTSTQPQQQVGDGRRPTNPAGAAEQVSNDSNKGGGASGSPVNKPHSQVKNSSAGDSQKKKAVSLVSHLPPYRDPDQIFDTGAVLTTKNRSLAAHLHPAVVTLGYAYATGEITGGNARCRAMLRCYAHVLDDYMPAGEDVRHAVDHQILKPSFQFWTETCRPHSVSMGNAFSFLKTAVAALDRDAPWSDMLETLKETMEAYCRERIEYADKAIVETACQKLLSDDKLEVLLTYGNSEAVTLILQQAAALGKKFRVIVVESPMHEGFQQLQTLRACDIECTYIDLSALTYVLQDVSKVLVGAAALMSDGSVVGRVGTAVVALAADSNHIPVLVCAETYKISNRVQLESITSNELGRNRRNATATSPEHENMLDLNILFDLTPASFVSGIVTELGLVPPSSVAVLLREMNPQELKSR